MKDSRDQENIDDLIRNFFSLFDNRGGRVPLRAEITDLFAEKAVIAKHHGGRCELYSPDEFAEPRVALLKSGTLIDFHEWEEESSAQIVGGIAARTSRYAKSGLLNGAPYVGSGTKFFQLAKFARGWRIVALTWLDDA